MKISDYITMSIANLGRQKLRTFLTVSSIVIGATLISLVYSVIPGIEHFLDLQLNTLSSPKLIQIYPSGERPGQAILSSFGEGPQEYQEGNGGIFATLEEKFTDEDLDKIREIDGIKEVYVPPYPSVQYLRFDDQEKKFQSGLIFFYPRFLLENIDLVSGTYFDNEDKGKAIIAYEYVEALGFQSPDELIGKKLKLHVVQSTLVSTLQASEYTNFGSTDLATAPNVTENDFEVEIVGVAEKTILTTIVFITYEDAKQMTLFAAGGDEEMAENGLGRSEAWVEIDDPSHALEIDRKITDLGFSGMTFDESKNVLNDIFGILTMIFSSFGVLAMAVSSLGILNTLVMAVYDRTREIGVMKAIGATKRNIAILFTIEAGLIGFIGGIIGIVLGYSISELLNYIGHKTVLSSFETLDISNISPLLLLGLAISTVVATIAGIYPALRAARLNPIAALRYE